MYNGIAAYINSNMSVIANDIARLHLGLAYFVAYASHSAGGMRKANTKRCIYGHYKSRAVRTVGQAGAAVYIWISNKLTCIINNCLSASA